MIMMVAYMLILILGLHSTRGMPIKPELSSFTAELTVLGGGTEIHAHYYANAKEKKQLQIATLGGESDNVQLYTWLLTEHNKTYEYDNMKPFELCTGISVPGPPMPGMSNVWFWLTNATYSGTLKFLNKTLDTWTYRDKVNEIFYQVGVLASSPNQPVYYLSTSALGLILFDKYENSAPSSSVFEIPASCKGTVPPEKFQKQHSWNFFNSNS